jgi:hypothetical protein
MSLAEPAMKKRRVQSLPSRITGDEEKVYRLKAVDRFTPSDYASRGVEDQLFVLVFPNVTTFACAATRLQNATSSSLYFNSPPMPLEIY